MQGDQKQPPPRPIDYAWPAKPASWYVPATVQVVAGIAAAVATLGTIWGLLAGQWIPPVIAFAIPLGVLISGVVWIRVRFEWRSFLPGVLIGFALSCLIGVGTVFYLCSHQ